MPTPAPHHELSPPCKGGVRGGGQGSSNHLVDERRGGGQGSSNHLVDERRGGGQGSSNHLVDERRGGGQGSSNHLVDERQGGRQGPRNHLVVERRGGRQGFAARQQSKIEKCDGRPPARSTFAPRKLGDDRFNPVPTNRPVESRVRLQSRRSLRDRTSRAPPPRTTSDFAAFVGGANDDNSRSA